MPLCSSLFLAALTALLPRIQDGGPAPVDDAAALRRSLDRFGADLGDRLASSDANLCLSPASVAFALLMTLEGARGETAAELQRLLCPADWEALRAGKAAAKLLASLRDSPTIELAVVNDLWPATGHALLPEFRAATVRDFGANVRTLDFRNERERARKTINDHVAKATRDRIQDLLAPDMVTADTRLIVTNAVYFKAKWLHPFEGENSRSQSFTLGNGEKVKVMLMHQLGSFALAATDDVQVLRMRYADAEFAMDVVLPAPGKTIDVAAAALRPDQEARWAPKLAEQTVSVTLPRFRIDGTFQLRAALRALGLDLATTAGSADFSGIDGGAGQLFVDDVIHKTFIEVGEEGTEAAAATAVVLRAGAAASPRPPAEFRADRPFVFALRDLRTGLVLFAGRLADPRAR